MENDSKILTISDTKNSILGNERPVFNYIFSFGLFFPLVISIWSKKHQMF